MGTIIHFYRVLRNKNNIFKAHLDHLLIIRDAWYLGAALMLLYSHPELPGGTAEPCVVEAGILDLTQTRTTLARTFLVSLWG